MNLNRVGIRGRLFAASLGLAAIVLIPAAVLVERGEERAQRDRIDRELVVRARLARLVVEQAGDRDPSELVHQLGLATDRRVTLIGVDGAVRADSDGGTAGAREPLGARAELAAARGDQPGFATRIDPARGDEIRYVGLELSGEPHGYVRVAEPLAAIADVTSRLHLLFLCAALAALAAATLLAMLASQLLSRELRSLVDSARALTSPGGPRRITVHREDELAGLAGSMNKMAEEVERALATLADERGRFRAVLEGMSDAVIALDERGSVTLVNSAARELLAIDDRALSRSLLELVRAPALQGLLGDAAAERAEFELPGGRRVLARRAPPTPDGGLVLVMDDVTEVRRLETVRRDFVANVSHELRTPVAIVSANAETLAAGALTDPKAAPRLVEAIQRSATRLGHLIEGLLDLSRLESGKYQLEPEPVELADEVREALAGLLPEASRCRITVSSEVPAGLTARADRAGLAQVLGNLLDNAVKYGQEGGTVVIRGHAVGPRARLEIEDDGPGIPSDQRERIFERFYRIDRGRSRDMGGTGLGLAIVKHLVEAMDGAVGVEAREPRGSRFWVELPRPG